MSLLTPDTGLLFWMTIAFLFVFIVLAKYGFPVITQAAAKRQAEINSSLDAAREAREKLVAINAEAESIMEKARAERNALLAEAQQTKNRILADAAEAAEAQTRQRLERAKAEAEEVKAKALDEIRDQIAGLSVAIAEKVLGQQLKEDKQQQDFIERMLKDESLSKSGAKWIEE